MKDLGRNVQLLRIAADFSRFLRIAADFSRFLSSRDFLSSTNFDVYNSDDINSACCITKSSIFIQLKSSNWVVVKSSMSGLMRYENKDP